MPNIYIGDFITPKSVLAQTTFNFHHDVTILLIWILGFIIIYEIPTLYKKIFLKLFKCIS